MKIIAIDGEAFDADLLTGAIKRAAKDKQPVELLVQILDYYSTLRINYAGGEKYPRLERVDGKVDLLTPIATAR